MIKSSPRLNLVIALALTLIGATLTGVLWKMHVVGKAGAFWTAACGGEGSGCDKVIASRWSVFPPPPEGSTDRKGSIPVAALGMFTFSALGIWAAVIGLPTPDRARMRKVLLAISISSCATSIFFIILMATAVGAWCPLCLGSHVCNFLLLGHFLFLVPRAPVTAAPPFPGKRLHATAAALMVAVLFGEWQAFKALGLEAEISETAALVEKYSQDAHALELTYMQAKQVDLPVRGDDPTIEALPGIRNTVVLFSDIECPHCAKFDRFLFEEIKPLYKGRLRIVFKHFPLEKIHPNAFRGATALEAARLQGKFWEMHDLLLKNRERLGSVKYDELGRSVGLETGKFLADMESPAVHQRIRDDMQQGQRLGLHRSPEVFLNSRLLDKLARDLLGFWKLRAEAITKPKG